MSERDEYFMRLAIKEAEAAFAKGEVPVGAVLVANDKVMAMAHNSKEFTADPTAHAELLVIREGAVKGGEWRMTDATLYVTKEPCVMCAGASVLARIDRLVYGTPDPKFGGCSSLYQIPTDTRLNHRLDVVAGVLADEAAALMRDFFARRRREGARQF